MSNSKPSQRTGQRYDNHLQAFANAIEENGLGRPDVNPDGVIHRFHVPGDKPGSRNGWLVLFLDADKAGGAFGSWKTGERHSWHSQGDKITPQERKKLREEIKRATEQRKAAIRAQQEETAQRATQRWNAASTAATHPYLRNKRVLAFDLRQDGDLLLVPIRDIAGKLWNLQTIDPNGKKLFMKAGRIKGCFHLIGGPIDDRAFVAEGYATAATAFMHLRQSRKLPVAVAFNANNLAPVAWNIRQQYPAAQITILADNDANTPGNPGMEKAKEAMYLVNGDMLWPDFTDEDGNGSDFNDLYCLKGVC